MYLGKRICLLLLVLLGVIAPVIADQAENQLTAVFLGRFANYVEFPYESREEFVITVFGDNLFGSILEQHYQHKSIKNKPVRIRHIKNLDEIELTDILFISHPSLRERRRAIEYAHQHHILSVSHFLGFAENGGIIQINFIAQKAKIKINHHAAVDSQIRIAAPLLSIATVLEDRP